MTSSPYRRQPPPFPVRCLLGLVMDGVFNPFGWVLEKLNWTLPTYKYLHEGRLRSLRKADPFRGYTPGRHDVFIATYPKSGTNWMMQIVTQLCWHGKAEFEHIHYLVPWPDSEMMGPLKNYAVPIEDDSTCRQAPEQMRAVKTHLNWGLFPYSEQARYILVIRDPKDVFVSGFHFFKESLMGRLVSKQTWIDLFQSEYFPLGGSWAENAAGFWAQRHRPNVLVLSFKNMKKDLASTVSEVARFLDIALTETEMHEVCAKSSFAYMKGMDHKFDTWDLIPWRKHTPMIRKGAQGGSSELLSLKQQRDMDAHFQTELKRLASDLPYEQFADLAGEG